MKKLRISRTVTLGVTTILVLLVLLFFIFRSTSLVKSITTPISGFTAKIDNIVSYPFRWGKSAKTALVDLFKTYDENKSLKGDISKLKDQASQLENLKEENKTLSAALATEDSFSNYKTITSKVTVRSSLSWYESLTVGVGEDDGVTKSMLATSDGGLIGKVSDLGDSSTSLQLIANSEATYEVPVKISSQDGELYGILTGYDAKKNSLIIEELNVDRTIEAGDAVVTSGLDGESIAGVSVGKVTAVSQDKALTKRKVYVTPTADLDNISYVTLIGK